MFKLYREAGLPDFKFMSRCSSVDDLRNSILQTGSHVGSSKSIWANEFAIREVSRALNICCLILDNDAKDEGSRYIKVGNSRMFVVLSRGNEHYNLIFMRGEVGTALCELDDLSSAARRNWRL